MAANIIFTNEEVTILLEAARKGLADADNFDELTEHLDLSDEVMVAIREKITMALETDEEIEFAPREDGEALSREGSCANDYTLNPQHMSCWITVDSMSVHVSRAGGVTVNIYRKGDEMDAPVAEVSTPLIEAGADDHMRCTQCDALMMVTETGVSHHVDKDENIDHDADADHVALAPEEDDTFVCSGCKQTFDNDDSVRIGGRHGELFCSDCAENFCRNCGGPNTDGEGFDGLCGSCADKTEPLYIDDGQPDGNERFTRAEWQQDVGNGDTKLGYAEWVNYNIASAKHCESCGADLYALQSVTREYVDKEGGESVFGKGHYNPLTGDFEADIAAVISGGRYDLVDDSDECTNCNRQL